MNSTNVACSAGGCGGAINTTYGNGPLGVHSPPTNASFGSPTAAFNSRQVQLGGRIRF